MEGFKGDFGGFFSRLLEVAVVSPEVGSVFATVHKNTARPGCTYAYVLMSDQAKDGRWTHSVLGSANLGDRSSLGTVVALSGSSRSTLEHN
jgi:hypothetical protein